jgi:basic membrane protein A and related proteins
VNPFPFPFSFQGTAVTLRRLVLLTACAWFAAIAPAGAQPAADGLTLKTAPKIAFLYDGPVTDGGWTQAADEARKALEAEMKTKVAYVENVPAGDSTRVQSVVERLISRGDNVIIGSAFAFSDPFKAMADAHPDVAFINIAGKNHAPNLATVYGRSYESQYLCGMAAAYASPSGKLGFIASNPYGQVNWAVNAYLLGARQVKPEATVTAIFTGSWNDPVKERAAASAMIDQGIDVIGQITDAPTPQIVAQERGIHATGMGRDFRQFAPKATVCSSIWVWNRALTTEIKKIAAGHWKPTPGGDFLGIASGGTDIACCSSLPAGAEARIKAERQAIVTGKQVYAGPIVDTTGKQRVPPGATLSDADLWKMDWYVKGVITQGK